MRPAARRSIVRIFFKRDIRRVVSLIARSPGDRYFSLARKLSHRAKNHLSVFPIFFFLPPRVVFFSARFRSPDGFTCFPKHANLWTAGEGRSCLIIETGKLDAFEFAREFFIKPREIRRERNGESEKSRYIARSPHVTDAFFLIVFFLHLEYFKWNECLKKERGRKI